jgi:hypothetical protein
VQGVQRHAVAGRVQVVVHLLVEEQLLQLGGRQGQGGAVGQQRLLLFVGDPAASGGASVGKRRLLGQPRLDLRQNALKQCLAPRLERAKSICCTAAASREPWLLGSPSTDSASPCSVVSSTRDQSTPRTTRTLCSFATCWWYCLPSIKSASCSPSSRNCQSGERVTRWPQPEGAIP